MSRILFLSPAGSDIEAARAPKEVRFRIMCLWDISGLPEGHLIEVACKLLPNHDTSNLKDRYGIATTTPICGAGTPALVATELQD